MANTNVSFSSIANYASTGAIQKFGKALKERLDSRKAEALQIATKSVAKNLMTDAS